MTQRVFEQAVTIQASIAGVERCFTDLNLMHQWLNPALRCEPIGAWQTTVGSQSRFIINIPVLQPTLQSVVVERAPGLVVWQFSGFFEGRDRWQCQTVASGTQLWNRFEFTIPNPVVAIGFDWFAARLTQADMQAQLKRLQHLAEQQ
ncbi:MAG: SRPBCC family protein [Cyanobacteria bacterium P01_H01_bin.121]